MSDVTVLQLAQNALFVALKVAAPVLGLSLLAGLLVSVFQAATQIQETTLTFVPKIMAMVAALFLFGPWMLHTLVEYTGGLMAELPRYVR